MCLQVLSQLLRKAKQKDLVLPNVKQAGSEQGTYEGATVSNIFLDHIYFMFTLHSTKANWIFQS